MSLPPAAIVGVVALVVGLPPTAWAVYQFHQRRGERRQQSLYAQKGQRVLLIAIPDVLPIFAPEGYYLGTLNLQPDFARLNNGRRD